MDADECGFRAFRLGEFTEFPLLFFTYKLFIFINALMGASMKSDEADLWGGGDGGGLMDVKMLKMVTLSYCFYIFSLYTPFAWNLLSLAPSRFNLSCISILTSSSWLLFILGEAKLLWNWIRLDIKRTLNSFLIYNHTKWHKKHFRKNTNKVKKFFFLISRKCLATIKNITFIMLIGSADWFHSFSQLFPHSNYFRFRED